MEETLEQEQRYLDRTLSVIDEQITEKETECRRVPTSRVEEQLRQQSVKELRSLKVARKNPYFGRLDFQDEFGEETIYIGKKGIQDETDLVVVDWRTDLGELYNKYRGVKSEFFVGDDPDHKVTILRKRAIVIEEDRVVKVRDVGKTEVVETPEGKKVKRMDPYLEEVLRQTGDRLQLREIIASIQEEQDEIIRLPLDHTVIVQGAAGSGKSTIALHRVSYLLYQYKERLSPDRVLVLAPNEMFLSYIQGMVPELEIEGIEQRTFYDWASTYFTDVREISDLHEDYVEVYGGGKREERIQVAKFKGSLRFKKMLDDLMADAERQALPKKDFHLTSHHTLTKEEMKAFYESRLHLPFNPRLQELKQFILDWQEEQERLYQEQVEAEFEVAYRNWVITLPEGEERKNMYAALERAKKLRIQEFTKRTRKEVQDYVRRMQPITAYDMYLYVFRDGTFRNYAPDIVEKDEKLFHQLLRGTAALREKKFSYEDIAPLIYLDAKINGKSLSYEQIVIDEAQDYSPFQLAILKDYAKSMTVLGDVAQGIFSFYGLDSWEEFQSYIADQHEVKRIDIQTGYRSTKEIMDLANRVLINNNYPYPLVIPVNREGKEPQLEEVQNYGELCDRIEATLQAFLQKGHKTIAVLTNSVETAADLHDQLLRRGLTDVELITNAHQTLQQQMVIIPTYLVKGLEFDAVILEDVSEMMFPDQTHYAKLLYMSITRAQHELVLFYRGNLSPLLEQRDPAEPPPPRPSFADWLITDYHDPNILPEVEKERIVEDTETLPLFEEEASTTLERFEEDRERVSDFHAWREVWKKWAQQQKTNVLL